MNDIKLTPMQEVIAAVHEIRSKSSYEASPMLFMQWMATNVDRLLYEEKYLIIDTYDAAADPEAINQINFKKTAGQIFFEKNFINL